MILFAAFALWLPSYIMTGERQTLEDALTRQSASHNLPTFGESARVTAAVGEELNRL